MLAERASHVRVTAIAAGLHVLLELPGGADREELVISRAAGRALSLEGLSSNRHVGAEGIRPAVVVAYSTPPEHAFSGAIEALCEVL